MIRLGLIVVLLIGVLMMGCTENTGPDSDDDLHLIDIQIITEADTLLLLSGETVTLDVQGIYVQEEDYTVTNNGALTGITLAYSSMDTIIERLDRSNLDWQSSDTAVVTVSQGVEHGVAPGSVIVTATMNDIMSIPCKIRVGAPDLAPELIIDPPPTWLVFRDSAEVSGWVQSGMDITLTLNQDTISYNDKGKFMESVFLALGENTFTVTAMNNVNGLSTSKSKRFIYAAIETSGIAGYWEGETLTRPFGFEIYEFLGEYLIDGTLSVDLTLLGGPFVVQDIIISGLINDNGTINANLNAEYSGFTITGNLSGIFFSTGTAGGSYTVRIEKPNWPTLSHTEPWTAEKQALTD